MNLRRGPKAAVPGVVGALSGLALPWMMSPACLAQGGGGLAGHLQALLFSAGVLVLILVGLVVWEFLDRRSSAPVASEVPGAEAAGQDSAGGDVQEEEDPFRALLKKASSDDTQRRSEAAEAPAGGPEPLIGGPMTEEVPVASDTGGPASAASERMSRGLDEEELSPFQRLAQIGSEDRIPPMAPLPETPARAPRIDLAGGGAGEKSGPVGSEKPGEKPGGDWASLLSKVQIEASPTPRGPVFAPKAGEEDPWKKLLGQAGPEPAVAPTPPEPPPAVTGSGDSAAETDPWKALLSKASPEAPAVPETAPAPPTFPAIKLGSTEPPSTTEPPRPRSISLDVNASREEGRRIPPPPQTEDE